MKHIRTIPRRCCRLAGGPCCAAAVTTLLLLAGCQTMSWDVPESLTSWDMKKSIPWQRDAKAQPPLRIVGSWADAVRHTPGQSSERGFGGRISFFGRTSDESLKVDGQLVVYAFDEEGRSPTDNRPTRRYVFPRALIDKHRTDSETGPFYSFWLPWDDVGGDQKRISLIVRFQPVGAPVVISEQTRHILPGKLSPEQSALMSEQTDQRPAGEADVKLLAGHEKPGTGVTNAGFTAPVEAKPSD